MKKKVAIIGIIVLVIALFTGVAYWLFASGRLVWTNGGTQGVAASKVCGSDIVTQYNDAMNYIPRSGSDQPSFDIEGAKKIAKDIEGKTNYRNDATCQTLLYLIAINTNDYSQASAAAKAVEQLHKQGAYPDNNIRGNMALFDYDSTVMTLSPAATARGSNVH